MSSQQIRESVALERPERREQSLKLERVDEFDIWLLGRDRFADFNRFVYKVYSEAFASADGVPFSFEDIVSASEQNFDRAKVCAVTDHAGALVGTWGLVVKERGETVPLPLEAEFGISIETVLEKVGAPDARYVFNGWRTAVDKEALAARGIPANRSIFVFDLLLRGLTEDFVDSEQFVGVAEMEKLVLRYHKRIGVPWVVLGEPHHYWGRDRYPCAFRLADYRDTLREQHPERYELVYGKRHRAAT